MARLVLATSLTAPWGPIRLAASARGLVALDQLVTADAFAERLERRFGMKLQSWDREQAPAK